MMIAQFLNKTDQLLKIKQQIYFHPKQNITPIMNMFYASERQRQLHNLKQKKYKSILLFNLSEIQRKKKQKETVRQQTRSNINAINQQALDNLIVDRRRQSQRRQHQKNVLKESYERQIRDREMRKRSLKESDRKYYQVSEQHREYQQQKRIVELEKMYNRVTYTAVPYQSGHEQSRFYRKIKTETRQAVESEGNPPQSSTRMRLKTDPVSKSVEPYSFDLKTQKKPGMIVETNWNNSNMNNHKVKDSLDDLNVQMVRYCPKAPGS